MLCASRWETVVFAAHECAAEALHALHFVRVHAQGLACADAAALPCLSLPPFYDMSDIKRTCLLFLRAAFFQRMNSLTICRVALLTPAKMFRRPL